MFRRKITLSAAALSLVLATSLLRASQSYEVTMERGVTASMRDGVILRADIYRPKADGQFPVLLQRTPYNKSGAATFAFKAAATGYVVIIQDVRGRYDSDGDWYTFKHEANDGYDTVEWAAALPYSNGKVGMWGGSYVGATQMLTAIAHPPHLAGICPIVTASNYHENWTYQGGAFEQWFNQSWTSGLAQDTFDHAVKKNTNALGGAWKLPLASYPLFNFSDPASAPISTATLAPYFLDWLAHPTYDQYWKQISIEEHFGDINVPVLSIAAWYDIFQGGSLRNYVGIKAYGGSEAARKGQHLYVTIGGHAGGGRKIGEVDFGPAAAEFDENELTLKWYDYLFKGVQNEFGGKPVKIFVMGSNQWREEDDWPLARAQSAKYFLHSTKNANSLRGEGSLSTASPRSESADTPAFTQDTEVTGPVSLELFAKSSAVDTDFTAKLVDVGPDGFAQNLTEGIIRARYRDSQEKANLMNPGQVYKFTIDLWSTSNVFLKGHMLRLEISSSNFPRFDRNLNTGEDPAFAKSFVSATNTVYHDAEHPSALILPLVPAP